MIYFLLLSSFSHSRLEIRSVYDTFFELFKHCFVMQPLQNSLLRSSTVDCGCSKALFRIGYIESSCLMNLATTTHILFTHSYQKYCKHPSHDLQDMGEPGRSLLARRFSTVVPQSIQSGKLFLWSSELGLPHPLTRRRVCTV